MNQTASGKMKSTVAEIPFKLVSNVIHLRVSVNKSAPLTFILDTGASNSLISLERSDELNLKSLAKVPVGAAGTAEVFGHIIESANLEISGLENFTVPIQVAIPFAELAPFEGNRIDGVLGYEFFTSFTIEIDYEAQILRLYDKNKFAYSGKGAKIPLEFKHNHPHLKCRIRLENNQTVEGDFVVDTGAGLSLSLTKSFTENNRLLEKVPQKIRTVTAVGANGLTHGFVGRFAGLELGEFYLENPIVSFMLDEKGVFATSEFFEGLIGGELLKKFKVIFDYEGKRMILEKNSSFEEPQNYDTSGIILALENGDFKVAALTENSPATEAGLNSGDALIEIEGVPTSQFSLHEISEKLKAEVPLGIKIRRGNSVLEKRLNLRKLV